jgi:lipopolysaccharide heptosyltransferase I
VSSLPGNRFAPQQILIIRLSALGDVIRTLPLLTPLHNRFPEARLAWLSEPGQAPVLRTQPLLDEVLEFPRGALAADLTSGRLLQAAQRLRGCIRAIRRPHFDVVLDAQGTYKSGLLMRVSGAPRRIGFSRTAAKEFLYGAATQTVTPEPERQSRVTRTLSLLDPLGGDPALAAADLPRDDALAQEAGSIWGAGRGPRILMSPGASQRQSYKRWPPHLFAAAAEQLAAGGAQIRIAWGPGEEELAQTVVDGAPHSASLLPPTSLLLLAEVLRGADLFIGNDSGPMHLAWLVKTPVVALYGATDPLINAPWGEGHRQVAVSSRRRRELGRDPRLMEDITPDQVVAAARSILSGAA